MLKKSIADAVGASEPVYLVDEDTTLDAAQAMLAHRAGVIVVQLEGKPEGLVTERDLVRRVVASRRLPQTVSLSDVMSKEIVTLAADETVEAAMDLMAEKNFATCHCSETAHLLAFCVSMIFMQLSNNALYKPGRAEPLILLRFFPSTPS